MVVLASGEGLLIDELPQSHQGWQPNTWLVLKGHRTARGLIEHPAGHDDSQIRLDLHQHTGVLLPIHSTKDDDITLEKRMKPIDDPGRTELMSSVRIRCGIRAPRTWCSMTSILW